jgi:hypothetical protein
MTGQQDGQAGARTTTSRASGSQWGALLCWKVYALGAMDGMCGTAKFGIIYWAPLLIAAILTGRAGVSEPGAASPHSPRNAPSPGVVVLLTAIPFGIAAAFTLGNAYHSKLTGASTRTLDLNVNR